MLYGYQYLADYLSKKATGNNALKLMAFWHLILIELIFKSYSGFL
jgi:hypothetical protein